MSTAAPSSSGHLGILWENPRFIVVDKPAGLLSIPGANPREPSVLKLLSRLYPRQSHLPVHRIDRETSGALLFARDEEAHREANRWFEKHLVKKEYLAIAKGRPRLPAFRVNRPIGGKPSLSQIAVVERFGEGETSSFLARVRIATGRRHQIRIHLEAEGFPILGDAKYGGPSSFAGFEFARFALHAERLALPAEAEAFGVPSGNREFVAPMPEDFRGWVEGLRGSI
ncbi:MAG: RluA family pseudouridine synthase [Bdellovibrionales bacterium]|nr:RluA family pseudouridine synthase [Bdellovibrionales bacterium]